jgi:Cdc6-like AAA superfamily ATPase
MSDLFGLERESKITKSGVREVFTPHKPIPTRTLFFGRQTEVQKLIEHINTPGQHALLYGDRGVGKSSLANVTVEILLKDILRAKLFTKRCDSTDTFETILHDSLAAVGIDPDIKEMSATLTEGGQAGLKIPVASAGVKTERKKVSTYKGVQYSPSKVAEALKTEKAVMFVDELDSIASAEKRKLAELIKLLSDEGSPFKVLLVGIAKTAEELTAAHPSVQRCLKETRLRRMGREELKLIITEGAKKLRLTFAEDVIRNIVNVSLGYPHFTHLLALKCAEEAIANNQALIAKETLLKALETAAADAEGTLRRQYEIAVRSYTTEMYATILKAAALIGKEEFSAGILREKIKDLTGTPISQGTLNNFLKELVNDSGTTVLVRKAKGIYSFSDPRMPSFVLIVSKHFTTE